MKTVHVAAAVMIRGDRVYATQRGYGEFKDKWEFPGGKVEAGETPEKALSVKSRKNWLPISRWENGLRPLNMIIPNSIW